MRNLNLNLNLNWYKPNGCYVHRTIDVLRDEMHVG